MKDPYGVINAIKTVMAECEFKRCKVEWFLFGSFLNDDASSDIDLLAITTEGECMKLIRMKVEEILLSFPVELTIMSQAEEAELNFVAITQARSVAETFGK